MQIAFSAITAARKTFHLDAKCRRHFADIYGVRYSYYSLCVRDILNIDNKVEYILTEGATNKKEKKLMRREEKRDSMHYKSNLTLTNKLILPQVPPIIIQPLLSFRVDKSNRKIVLTDTAKNKKKKINFKNFVSFKVNPQKVKEFINYRR